MKKISHSFHEYANYKNVIKWKVYNGYYMITKLLTSTYRFFSYNFSNVLLVFICEIWRNLY